MDHTDAMHRVLITDAHSDQIGSFACWLISRPIETMILHLFYKSFNKINILCLD
jgi:hypothetical protein